MLTPAAMTDAWLDAVALAEAVAKGDHEGTGAIILRQRDGLPLITTLTGLLVAVLNEHQVDIAEWAQRTRGKWLPPQAGQLGLADN
jgi:hypothetical protein